MRALLSLLVVALLPAPVRAQPKLRLEIGQNDIDVAARTIHFRLSTVAKRTDIEVFSPDGQRLYAGQQPYVDARPGERLAIGWPDLGDSGDNFRIELKFTDAQNNWVTFQVIRFYVEIPHEEVEFDTGKWDVKLDQQQKLKKPLALLKDAAAKYGALLHVALYVTGHTDTVGQAADNQRLSERRAQAIAQWFADHGLEGIPIFARGFGESVPAVHTPDNVAEQKNRRVQYIVSSFEPPLAGPGRWRRVH